MKRIMKICAIGVCIGIILAMIQIHFHIDESVFWFGYRIAASVILVGVIWINLLYNRYYFKKIRNLAEQFLKEDTQKYIDGMEALLKTAKGQGLRNILILDLAAGYMEKQEYEKAICVLDELANRRLRGSSIKLFHCYKLFICYFETQQYKKAITLYNENQKRIEKFRYHKKFGAYVAILDVLAAMIRENYQEAEEMLESAKKTYEETSFQEIFQIVSNMLDDINGKSYE